MPPKGKLSPNKLWRQRFQKAFEAQSEATVLALLEQWKADPSLSWVGDSRGMRQTPLDMALRHSNAWGVAILLEENHPVTSDAVEHAFVALGQRKESPALAEAFLREVWDELLPHLLKETELRAAVFSEFLQESWSGALEEAELWHALGMPQITENLLENVLNAKQHGCLLSPLQQAWLKFSPAKINVLLDAGASPIRPHPESGMPTWTLLGAMDDFPDGQRTPDWNAVEAKVRAADLDQRLPEEPKNAEGKPRGPRF